MNHKIVTPKNRQNAKTMRSNMTPAELKLWNELRAHRLMELSFRRQVPILEYIVDFACPSLKLIVEVDGSQHGRDDVAKGDDLRTQCLQSLGWTIIRFWNDDVIKDIDGVCQHIVLVAEELKNAMERP